MNRSEIKQNLREKKQRQQAFFEDKSPGLLAYAHINSKTVKQRRADAKSVAVQMKTSLSSVDSDDLNNKEGLAGYIYRAVMADDGSIEPSERSIESAVDEYVELYREEAALMAPHPLSDAIPCVYPHWDIGWHTAAMVGLPPSYSRGSWWLEPHLDWDAIEELQFDPDNPWLITAKYTHRALWKYWNEDYWTMPFVHRSPLDYANGLRGTTLFLEMITDPARVKRLLDWCVDWQLATEDFIYEDIALPQKWGTGIMGTLGPEKAVWVNGDPVGMISRDMMCEFEQPYSGRLFRSTGGGFFHNHTMGLYQVDQVSATPGIHMQNFTRDPNKPTVEQSLIDNDILRDRILIGSLQTPILISGMTPASLKSVLPILRDGRFLLGVECSNETDLVEVVRSVRRASNSE